MDSNWIIQDELHKMQVPLCLWLLWAGFQRGWRGSFHHEDVGKEKASLLLSMSQPWSNGTFCLPTKGPGSPTSQRDLGTNTCHVLSTLCLYLLLKLYPFLPHSQRVRGQRLRPSWEGRKGQEEHREMTRSQFLTQLWSPGRRGAEHILKHITLAEQYTLCMVPSYQPRGSWTQLSYEKYY